MKVMLEVCPGGCGPGIWEFDVIPGNFSKLKKMSRHILTHMEVEN